FSDNYLLEKPQYSLSYNNKLKTPNWVSYQLNKSWLAIDNKNRSFTSDPRLPFATQIEEKNIPRESDYQRGHMTSASHRSRNEQDNVATFLMTNILPQPLNKPFDRWTELEKYLVNNLVEVQNKELYIIAGRGGETNTEISKTIKKKKTVVNVPDHIWKVVLVLDKPGQGISDVTKDAIAFGIYLPNTLVPYSGSDPKFKDTNGNPLMVGQDPDNEWRTNFKLSVNGKNVDYGLFNIDKIEELTKYDFFSNIPTEIQNVIEGRKVNEILRVVKPAPLMAEPGYESKLSDKRTTYGATIGHNNIVDKISITPDHVWSDVSVSEISINKDGIFKTTNNISATEESAASIHMIEVGSAQVGFRKTTPTQVSGIQISIPHNGVIQLSEFQGNTKQIRSSQISTTQIGLS
ncbi:MAG: DNA/RNA non-specific endonuclease, partial [Cyanobacteria bacterium J06635_10]